MVVAQTQQSKVVSINTNNAKVITMNSKTNEKLIFGSSALKYFYRELKLMRSDSADQNDDSSNKL